VRRGSTAEDLTRGHSLMADPDARAIQEQFVDFASNSTDVIRGVLRNSKDEVHRAIAAYVIGYANQKSQIVDDLLYALQDPDDTVRANAIRALAALSVLARLDPKSGIKISPTWYIEMLNSIYWTDRNNAVVALATLTEARDERTMAVLRERALPALVEMASWKHLPHALPAYIVLGRAIGVPETELQDTWSRGQRETIIQRASSSKKSTPPDHR
jgi:hypothetical protein